MKRNLLRSILVLMFSLFIPKVYSQWTVAESGTTLDLSQVQFVSSYKAFALGGNITESVFLVTLDGGESWQPMLEGRKVFGFDFWNEQTGAVLGNDTVYRTMDGGENWDIIAVETPQEYVGSPLFKMLSLLEWIYVRGQYHAHTLDAGLHWVETSLGNNGPLPLVPTELQQINDTTLLGVGWYGPQSFISLDKGNTWAKMHAFDNASYVSSCFFVNLTFGFVTVDGTILQTKDGGFTWESLNDTFYMECIRYIDEENVYAVGREGVIIHSSDAGVNWEQENVGTNMTFKQLEIKGNRAIAVGEDGLIAFNPAWSGTTKIIQQNHRLVRVYPNPTMGDVRLDWNSLKQPILRGVVYNSVGGIEDCFEANGRQFWDLKALKPGTYIVYLFPSHSEPIQTGFVVH